jgi:aspartyl-tRNA synthetase
VQVVFHPEGGKDLMEVAKKIRSEFVIRVEGEVAERPEGTENPKLPTGEIEVIAHRIEILNECEEIPYPIFDPQVQEAVRLEYRYLDLRTPSMQESLFYRHRITHTIRHYLHEKGFWEIETPILSKSTPEGARDFLVPSRLQTGSFYALPQSPQLYKQILMIGGIERYYQIARCFRDEDLRADRQPEFTQVDIEMSFVEEKDLMEIVEEMVATVLREVFGKEISLPFPKIPYKTAIEQYGTDAPDLRIPSRIFPVTPLFSETKVQLFREIVEKGGQILALPVPTPLSQKQLKTLEEYAKEEGMGGLAWLRVGESWQGPIARHLSPEEKERLKKDLSLKEGDLLLLGGGKEEIFFQMGKVRTKLYQFLSEKEDSFHFLWVVDFPMFTYDEEEKRLTAVHHPFTAIREEDWEKVEKEPLQVRSRAYDLVLNGVEIGGGSIRNHLYDRQKKIFELLEIPKEIYEERFGFLLKALSLGAPPHGGIALGLDRFVALLLKKTSIREVIPFPKTQRGQDLMMGSPSPVDPEQLLELGIRVLPSRER